MRLTEKHNGLSVRAPAKLNLFLEVLGKRTDKFHELQTLMVSINLYDTLTFTEEENGSIELCVSGPTAGLGPTAGNDQSSTSAVPSDQNNLVVKAARLLRERAPTNRAKQTGVRIHLTKRIPVAAGLAGGSSDAAATLVALNHFWKTGLTNAELMDLAAQLGSDISFFIPSVKRPYVADGAKLLNQYPCACLCTLWLSDQRPVSQRRLCFLNSNSVTQPVISRISKTRSSVAV